VPGWARRAAAGDCAGAVRPPWAAGQVRSGRTRRRSFRHGRAGVRVDVLVTEGNYPVAGLTASDFELRDNGVPQRIEVVEAGDVPLNAVLALDASASIAGKRQKDLIGAGRALLDGLKPADRAALTTFNHAVDPAIGLTPDLEAVHAVLERYGQTAVMDGVYVALASTLDPWRSYDLGAGRDVNDLMAALWRSLLGKGDGGVDER